MKKEKSKLQGIRQFASFLRPDYGKLILLLLFSMLTSWFGLYPTIILGDIVNHLTEGNTGAILWLIVLYAALTIVCDLCQNLYGYRVSIFSKETTMKLREWGFAQILRRRRDGKLKFSEGDTVSRMMQDINAVLQALGSPLNGFVPEVITGMMALVYLAVLSPFYLLIFGIVVPILYFSSKWINGRSIAISKSEREETGKLTNYLVNFFNHYILHCYYDGTEEEKNRFSHYNQSIFQLEKNNLRNFSVFWFLIALVKIAGIISVIVLTVLRVLSGEAQPGEILVAVTYCTRIFSPVILFSRYGAQLIRANASLQRFFELKNAEEDVLPIEPAEGAAIEELIGDQITYQYDRQKQIGPVSFHLQKGKMLVLYGPSGSGKSTVLKMISGLLSPISGQICINGEVQNDILQHFCGRICYVFQEPHLFNRSLRENILYGLKEPAADVQTAGSAVGLQELIEENKMVDTTMGNLSGGEQKRVSIARGLLRNADVFLFDEPTSGLDEATAEKIFRLIVRLKEDHIIIVSTHDARFRSQAEQLIEL